MKSAFTDHQFHLLGVILVCVGLGFPAVYVPGVGRFLLDGHVVAVRDVLEHLGIPAFLSGRRGSRLNGHFLGFGVIGPVRISIRPGNKIYPHYPGFHPHLVSQGEGFHIHLAQDGHLGLYCHADALFLPFRHNLVYTLEDFFHSLSPHRQGKDQE